MVKVEETFSPQIIKRQIISKKTVQYAQAILERVVQGEKGTAKSIHTDAYGIAGKTGTSIINFKAFKEKKAAKRYRSSFVGYFPNACTKVLLYCSGYKPT